MFEILPGILEKEWSEIEKKLEAYKGFAKSVHVDLIDGKFAPNTTFAEPGPFKKFSQDMLLELHMMVEDPVKYLKPFADAGFRRFIGHIEMMPNQVEFVAKAQGLGEVGLGIDADTSLNELKAQTDDLDSILIMSVKAGYSGQAFIEKSLDKVKELAARTSLPIEIDGGINEETFKRSWRAGARRFVATSYLWKEETVQKRFEKLLACGHEEMRI